MSLEAHEAFDHLKATFLQAPILAFQDFNKPFLLETDASGRGLGAVLSQKQADGQYHPIAYASHVMNETEMKPLTCSGPGELLHVDFTSIEETVPLKEEPVIRNVLVLQDHFSKYIVAYVVKDQTACTAAETLRIGYFGLFGAPAYLVSDQGKAFMGHIITHLCELYGVQKLRTSPYHAQTNGQVEHMN